MPLDIAVWLVLFVVFAIIEGLTTNLVTIWFCVGMLIAIIAALFGASYTTQVLCFVGASAACIAVLRPIAKKTVLNRRVRTNVEGLSGRTANVIEPVTPESGVVIIDGVELGARSVDGGTYEKGRQVTIQRNERNTLLINKCAEPRDLRKGEN